MAYAKAQILANLDIRDFPHKTEMEAWDGLKFTLVDSHFGVSGGEEGKDFDIIGVIQDDWMIKKYKVANDTYCHVPSDTVVSLINKHGGYKLILNGFDEMIERNPEQYPDHVKVEEVA